MSTRTQRMALRWIHLTIGALLNTYVYVTYFHPDALGWLHAFLVWAGIPVVVLTGVSMWQQGRLARLARRRR